MSMSTHVIGLRPPDKVWVKMKAVYDACDAAGVDTPREVFEFFGGEKPDERGVTVNVEVALTEWSDDMRQGYELDVRKLPKDVTIVRFYNSW